MDLMDQNALNLQVTIYIQKLLMMLHFYKILSRLLEDHFNKLIFSLSKN